MRIIKIFLSLSLSSVAVLKKSSGCRVCPPPGWRRLGLSGLYQRCRDMIRAGDGGLAEPGLPQQQEEAQEGCPWGCGVDQEGCLWGCGVDGCSFGCRGHPPAGKRFQCWDPAQHGDCTAPQEQRDLSPRPLARGSPGPLLGWRDALSVVQDRAN